MPVDNGHVHDHGRGVGAGLSLPARDLRRAVRYVASAAGDAEDCAVLLGALGLAPEDGKRKEAAA